MLGVDGALEYVTGQDDDPASVGLHADDATGDVTVELSRPGAEFVDVVASPTFGIVPPGVGEESCCAAAGRWLRGKRRAMCLPKRTTRR